jgi:hypothetical protein
MSAVPVDPNDSERNTLLPHSTPAGRANSRRQRVFVHAGLILITLIALPIFLFTEHPPSWYGGGRLPRNPRKAADRVLSGAPIIVCSLSSLGPYGPMAAFASF